MFMKRYLLGILIASLMVVGSLEYGSSSSAKPLTFKLGYVAPPIHVQGKTATFFKNYVEERSGGEIKIELYPMGQLGGQRAMLDSTLLGTLDMTIVGSHVLTTIIPEVNVMVLPFVVANEDINWQIIRNKEFRDKIFALIRAKGCEPLGFVDNTARGFLNTKRPVRKPEDIKGLQIRVMQGGIYTDMFAALGAKTRTMPLPEVYTALQQGLIVGEDNDIGMALVMKYVEVEKFFTELGQTIQTTILVIATPSFNKLTKDQRQIFFRAGEAMEPFAWETFKKDKMRDWKTARERYSVQIIDKLTPEEKKAFREAEQPIVDKYKKLIGKDLFDVFTSLANKYEENYPR